MGQRLILETRRGNYLYDQVVWIPEIGRVYQQKAGQILIRQTRRGNYLYDQAVWIPKQDEFTNKEHIIDKFPKQDGETICMTKWFTSKN